MTSRSLPALFLYFHQRSFDLKLFSYNWVPTQTKNISKSNTERVANLQQSKNTHPTASTSPLHCRCLLSKWLHCLLSARRHVSTKCHQGKQCHSDSITTLTWYFWLISGGAACQMKRALIWLNHKVFCFVNVAILHQAHAAFLIRTSSEQAY